MGGCAAGRLSHCTRVDQRVSPLLDGEEFVVSAEGGGEFGSKFVDDDQVSASCGHCLRGVCVGSRRMDGGSFWEAADDSGAEQLPWRDQPDAGEAREDHIYGI